MTKYLELEAAVQAFKNFDAGRADSPPYTLLTPEEFAEYLYELPTADVAPVVHGRWLKEEKETYCPVQYGEDGEPILHKYIHYSCSLCGRISGMPEPYCHCGAKMDGGADHEDD